MNIPTEKADLYSSQTGTFFSSFETGRQSERGNNVDFWEKWCWKSSLLALGTIMGNPTEHVLFTQNNRKHFLVSAETAVQRQDTESQALPLAAFIYLFLPQMN